MYICKHILGKMQIDSYIKELLLFQDCVIVPSLGGFVSNYQSAQQSEGSQITLMPPSKRIVFNQKLKHNDGLLIEYVSRHEACTFETAKAMVDSFVKQTHNSLAAHRSVEIAGLGMLSSTKNGYIRFDQSNEENLLIDSFGLGSIHVQALEIKTTSRRITRKTIVRLSVAASVALLIALIPTGVYTKIDTASFNIFASHPAVVVEHKQAPVAPKAQAETTSSEIATKLDEQTEKSNALLYVEEPKQQKAETQKTYSIVIGCYTDERHIEKAIGEAKAAGFTAEALKPENEYCTYRRLSAGTFSNREAAESALVSVKETYKDAWILTN